MFQELKDHRPDFEINEQELEVYNQHKKDGTSVKVNFNPKDWDLKLKDRSKGRMEIRIKLGSEEANSWKNFVESVKPESMDTRDFSKAMFLTGISATNERLAMAVRDYVLENQEELAASGIEVDTSDDVPIIKSFPIPELSEDTPDGKENEA